MPDHRFDDQVAIVTGAGRGIGRSHAELLASRGARVIVNDLGVGADGMGVDSGPAQDVVSAIRSAGGIAEADSSDIADPAGAQAIVEHAIDSFGRIDILVNNAGIFDTDEFPALPVAALHRFFDVHVGGSFNVSRAAWPYMAAANYGRIVMTSSTGILGASNQLAYGTAKAGVLGLARALAAAGKPAGIKVNTVAPMARTRMIRSAPPPDGLDRDPALVSPLVAYLCHADCPVSGEAFVAGMRRYSRIFIAETDGYVHPDAQVSIEDVVGNWDAVMNPAAYFVADDMRHWIAINTERISARTSRGSVPSGEQGGEQGGEPWRG
jgi:NAD(P)-dependent dehydrogenase (short-subunit alcohol dehydrogenase family)